MSDIKLFRIGADGVHALPSHSVGLEKSLQTLIERHVEALLGVRFVASEHATGKVHGGRIDTLGLDENNSPVIIEYKKALNENVINQGLFYLNWLMDHKAEFKLLVLDRYGRQAADAIDWSGPRLLCIAGDFTKYDEHAVQQIPRNIELIRYRRYGEDLLLLELVSATSSEIVPSARPTRRGTATAPTDQGGDPDASDQHEAGTGGPYVLRLFNQCSDAVHDRFEALRAYVLALGDVREKAVSDYIGFWRMRIFVSFAFRPRQDRILAWVNVDPGSASLEPGFTRGVQSAGQKHGQIEIWIDSDEDVERAKPLILQAYEAS